MYQKLSLLFIMLFVVTISYSVDASAQTISTDSSCVDISTGVDDIGNPLNHNDNELHWSLFTNGTESIPIVVNPIHTEWFSPGLLDPMWISPSNGYGDPAVNYTYSIDFNTPNTLSGQWQMEGSISADNTANSFTLDGQPITPNTSGPISWSTHRTFSFNIPVDTSLTMHTLTMDVPNFRSGNTNNPTGLLVDAQVCIIPLPQVDEEVITKDLHFGAAVQEYVAIKTPMQHTYLKQISCHIEDSDSWKSKKTAYMKAAVFDDDNKWIEDTNVSCTGDSAISEFKEPMIYLPPKSTIKVSTSDGGYYAVDVWLQILVDQDLKKFNDNPIKKIDVEPTKLIEHEPTNPIKIIEVEPVILTEEKSWWPFW